MHEQFMIVGVTQRLTRPNSTSHVRKLILVVDMRLKLDVLPSLLVCPTGFTHIDSHCSVTTNRLNEE